MSFTQRCSEEMRRLRPEGRIFGLGQADAPTAACLEFAFAVFGTAEAQTGGNREAHVNTQHANIFEF